MLSQIPQGSKPLSKEDLDKEVLRVAIIAELDAINLYEQLATKTDNKDLQTIFLDVAKEEKTHVGEFQTLLLELDKQQVAELEAGKKEVADELSK